MEHWFNRKCLTLFHLLQSYFCCANTLSVSAQINILLIWQTHIGFTLIVMLATHMNDSDLTFLAKQHFSKMFLNYVGTVTECIHLALYVGARIRVGIRY